METNFAKLSRYFLFLCRRERIASPVWIIALTAATVIFGSVYPGMLPDEAAMQQMAATMNNPAMIAMMGPVYGMEDLSPSSLMSQQCLVWVLVAAAIMNVFLVNRHSRVDEELGRLEMFRAMPVGRMTGAVATALFAFCVNLLISVLTAVSLLIMNMDGTTAAGAFAYGLAIGAVGMVFAALTLLAAQLFSTARGVTGFGMVALGILYVLRAMGDVRENALSIVSPLGLALRPEAFYENNYWPLFLLALEFANIILLALGICAYRDHGMGLLPAGKGRAYASQALRSPMGLAWRLSIKSTLAWGAGMLLLGIAYGSVCTQIESFLENNPTMKEMVFQNDQSSILDNYVAVIYSLMAMLASVPVMLSAMRIHGEEKHGRLEQIFAKRVWRIDFFIAFLFIGLMESFLMLLLLSTGLEVSSGGALDSATQLAAGLVYLPAVWCMTGIAVFFVGVLPKLTPAVWAIFAYSFFMSYFGRMLDFPEWVIKATPFGSTPRLPIEDFAAQPLAVYITLTVVLLTCGIARFRVRDIGRV
ncbi:MAG: hypothetical protein LBR14_03295 [Clostridiales Family XIII bacterium]|jgi:ABC-2 type transport system permease protein|nr:hypothetical protein [Clostridiales Family XIII bacterium]